MKRSFNYTERVKIAQGAVSVRLYSDSDGVQAFDTDIDLSDYKLPIGTKIYAEAYYRNALMRFEVGTYDPEQAQYSLHGQRLDELQDPVVNFRIKLVDVSTKIGWLVGVLERVQAFNENTRQVERLGLLPVNFGSDLGNRVWEVEFSEDGADPMLCINKQLKVEDSLLRDFVARDPAFVSLVFPQALRRILEQLIKEGVEDGDEESWQAKWVRFAASFGVSAPPNEDEVEEVRLWIDSVVDAFCDHTKIKTRFEAYLGEKGA